MIFPVLLNLTAAFLAGQNPANTPSKPAVKQPAAKQKPSLASEGYLPPAPLPGAVLAKVNGVPIRAADVDRLLWDWAGRSVMEDMILFELINQRAKLDKISVAPAEVEVTFQTQMEQIRQQVPPGQDMDTFIREKGFPMSRLYLHVKADLMMTRIVDLNFRQSDYISVSTLLVKAKSQSAADVQEAAGKAQDFYNRLKKGEDWDKVLASADQTPDMVKNHGALGWRAIDAFPPLTKVELRSLKLKDYTKPATTTNGIQIFRLDQFGATTDPSNLAVLKKQFEDRAKQTLAQDLQKAAKIERNFGKVAEKAPSTPKTPKLAKLVTTDIKVGTGDAVASGDEVWVRYTGKFADGKVFDSNDKPGAEPFHLTVGLGMVIKGWDQGLIGMKLGGKRKLSIPFALAYGPQGRSGIPPESDLFFDVEIVKIVKKK